MRVLCPQLTRSAARAAAGPRVFSTQVDRSRGSSRLAPGPRRAGCAFRVESHEK